MASNANPDVPTGSQDPPSQAPAANNPATAQIATLAANPVAPPPPPPASRHRALHAPSPRSSTQTAEGAPALLELAAGHPMYTKPRDDPSLFVADAQYLFYTLGLCDQMMNNTEQFTNSATAWMPIVSQLYIALLWITMSLKVYVDSGYAMQYKQLVDDLTTHLRLDECMIPGPLVPFFQALSAINGPFEWNSDIFPAIPEFSALWNTANFTVNDDFVRQIPIPALILDQLYAAATWTPADHPAGTSTYYSFEWYRNVFSAGLASQQPAHRVGPQTCGNIYTTPRQFDSARAFWRSALADFNRINASAEPAAPLTNFYQLLGLNSQSNTMQTSWIQHAATTMEFYSRFFIGSKPLKSILTHGIGACAIYATPNNNAEVRAWLYPTTAALTPFHTTMCKPLRDIPSSLTFCFNHSDHELEALAEQYAMLTHTNILWAPVTVANAWTGVNDTHTHVGPFWTAMPHRYSANLRLKDHFHQMIASEYHRYNAI